MESFPTCNKNGNGFLMELSFQVGIWVCQFIGTYYIKSDNKEKLTIEKDKFLNLKRRTSEKHK